MGFNEKYSKIFDIVKYDIEKIDLFDGIDVAEPLKLKFSGILNAPSKHIRPLVAFLYLKALGAEIDGTQIKYQKAIELVHNSSLIHDDIIDESSQRRGVETINSKFGNHLGVIAGDYLLSNALKCVVEIGDLQLIDMFRETLKTMTVGEIDQYFEKYKIPTIEEYIKKSEQKTAKLFETAVDGALLIAQCSSMSEHAKIFAKNFGIAFQIRDDLINCKTTKSDIEEGVYTAPVIFSGGLEISDYGLEKTRDLLNNYIYLAEKSLSNIEENSYKQALIVLLELLKDE